MPIASVADLVRLLEEYGLVEPEQRPQLARLAQAGPKDPRAFAREVLQRGWLTAYQINQLFQDNGASLLLGSYVVLERLGSGGMGNVFKARHQKLGKVVALKVIQRDKLSKPAVVKRFQREIQAAGKLDHPNIIHALDAEDVNGAQVLVMEYVEGTDLGKLVKENGPLPVREACEYVRQAALALQHAHEKGLVHRDIKPGNLMLAGRAAQPPGSPGVIKLLDLGLAMLQQPLVDGTASGPLTVAGKVVGTVDFIAPEQARDASSVDIRADLYSLGCTFYYLLTGRAPFGGATVTNKLFKHALEEPEPVERLRRDVPQPVAALIRRLMAKRPADRFQTPADVAAVLDDVLRGRSSRAVPALPDGVAAKGDGATKDRPDPAPPPAHPAAAPARPPAAPAPRKAVTPGRRRWIVLNVAGLAVLLVLVVVLVLVLSHYLGTPDRTTSRDDRPPQAERPAQAELDALRLRHQDGNADKEEIRRDLIAFRGRYPTLPQALQAAALLHELPSPLYALKPEEIPEERRFEGQPPELVAVLPATLGPTTAALVAPDGQRLLTASKVEGRPSPVVYGDLVTGGGVSQLKNVRGEVLALGLTADGRRAVLGGTKKHLGVWDVTTGREVRRLDGHGGDVTAAALSPDGRWALSGGLDKTVRLWDLEDGTMYPMGEHAEAVTAVAFTPDGRQALSAGADAKVRVWDVGIRRERKPAAEAPNPLTCLAVAPDGKRAYAGGEADVRRWSLGPPAPEGALEGRAGPVSALALTADGRYLAASHDDGWVGVWDLGSGQVTKEWKLPEARGVSWAIDGRHLAVAGGAGGVYLLRLPLP